MFSYIPKTFVFQKNKIPSANFVIMWYSTSSMLLSAEKNNAMSPSHTTGDHMFVHMNTK